MVGSGGYGITLHKAVLDDASGSLASLGFEVRPAPRILTDLPRVALNERPLTVSRFLGCSPTCGPFAASICALTLKRKGPRCCVSSVAPLSPLKGSKRMSEGPASFQRGATR